jgi:methionine-R-sulfoxide reductase
MRSMLLTVLALGLGACRASAGEPAKSAPAAPAAPAGAADGAWSKRLSDGELAARKKALPSDVYAVTQKEATEPPFHNAYWDNHAAGIYVDVVSGEPLFASLQKFESGTGWPSFWAPLEQRNIVTHGDGSLGVTRTELRSRVANSHLGHVFDDGPAPTHLRYCIDSASLRFVPAERLTLEGYGDYAKMFPSVTQAKK